MSEPYEPWREDLSFEEMESRRVAEWPKAKAFVDATAPVRGERFTYNKHTVLDWGWLKIEKNWHWRYSSEETHVTLKLPLRRRKFYCAEHDGFETGKPALFVAFGGIECSRHGFHMRGDRIYVDMSQTPYTPPPVIGYKTPVNLANYK